MLLKLSLPLLLLLLLQLRLPLLLPLLPLTKGYLAGKGGAHAVRDLRRKRRGDCLEVVLQVSEVCRA